jgi:hypothetical protein
LPHLSHAQIVIILCYQATAALFSPSNRRRKAHTSPQAATTAAIFRRRRALPSPQLLNVVPSIDLPVPSHQAWSDKSLHRCH